MTGIVKTYNADRGFGFIQPLIGKPKETPNVFFHISNVKGHRGRDAAGIPMGAEVRFDLVRGDRGPQAANVELIKISASRLLHEDKGDMTAMIGLRHGSSEEVDKDGA